MALPLFNTDTPVINTVMNPIIEKVNENESAIGQNTEKIAQLSNPNLLINESFKINQRGKTTYTSVTGDIPPYTVDRWQLANTGSAEITVDGINLTMTDLYFQFRQFVDINMDLIYGKEVTLSCKVGETIHKGTAVLDKNLDNTPIDIDMGNDIFLQLRHVTTAPNPIVIRIMNKVAGRTLTDLKWIKLELGEIATPLSPRPYGEELALCQRYYQIRSVNNVTSVDLRPTMRVTPTIGGVAEAYTYDAEIY